MFKKETQSDAVTDQTAPALNDNGSNKIALKVALGVMVVLTSFLLLLSIKEILYGFNISGRGIGPETFGGYISAMPLLLLFLTAVSLVSTILLDRKLLATRALLDRMKQSSLHSAVGLFASVLIVMALFWTSGLDNTVVAKVGALDSMRTYHSYVDNRTIAGTVEVAGGDVIVVRHGGSLLKVRIKLSRAQMERVRFNKISPGTNVRVHVKQNVDKVFKKVVKAKKEVAKTNTGDSSFDVDRFNEINWEELFQKETIKIDKEESVDPVFKDKIDDINEDIKDEGNIEVDIDKNDEPVVVCDPEDLDGIAVDDGDDNDEAPIDIETPEDGEDVADNPDDGDSSDDPADPSTDDPTDNPTDPGTDNPTDPGTDNPTDPGTDNPTPPVADGLPQSYAENLALIRGSSVTATQRQGIIWPLYEFVNFPLDNGNPYVNTPSAALSFNDFVAYRGGQYGPDKGRGPTGGVFHATCQFSHLAYDDPIVFPNQPARSHLHMFFGNTHANAYSTADSILNEGGSTCSRGELNRTSYWIPAAIDGNDNILVPDQFMVYYESYDDEWDTLRAFPEGMKMINGNALATSVQENIPNYGAPSVVWKCGWYNSAVLAGGGASSGYTSTPQNCADGQYSHIEMQVNWPFCWDGRSLDSADHKSHLAYPRAGNGYFDSRAGSCPSSHPVTIPRIKYRVHFDTARITSPTSQIRLSSDIQPANGQQSPNGVSGHADWYGGWNRELLQSLISNCILTGQECDEMHYGRPGGEQTAATVIQDMTITPNQALESCPYRSSYDGNIFNLAYCRQ